MNILIRLLLFIVAAFVILFIWGVTAGGLGSAEIVIAIVAAVIISILPYQKWGQKRVNG